MNKQAIYRTIKRAHESQAPVEYTYLDIRSEIRKTINELPGKLEELMVECKSLGRVYQYDRDYVLFITEESGDEIDYTIMHQALLKEVRILK